MLLDIRIEGCLPHNAGNVCQFLCYIFNNKGGENERENPNP